MQLDLEMSFVLRENIYALVEQLVRRSWPPGGALGAPPPAVPFEHMSYADAVRLYGSDKPDLRFGAQVRVQYISTVLVQNPRLTFLSPICSLRSLFLITRILQPLTAIIEVVVSTRIFVSTSRLRTRRSSSASLAISSRFSLSSLIVGYSRCDARTVV